MKLFISLTGTASNRNSFDYKVMFFLSKDFELLGSNYSHSEDNGYVYAYLMKEVEDTVDVEILRRKLSKDVNEYLDKQRHNKYLIDIRSGKEYGPPNSYNNQPDQYEIEFREQKEGIEKKISKFLKGNSKYLQVIPSHKIDYYTGMDRFIDFDETAISRLIDEDKLEEFNRLKEEAMKLKEYKAKNLIGIAHF